MVDAGNRLRKTRARCHLLIVNANRTPGYYEEGLFSRQQVVESTELDAGIRAHSEATVQF